jgi:hypothetical protein
MWVPIMALGPIAFITGLGGMIFGNKGRRGYWLIIFIIGVILDKIFTTLS